MPFSSLFRSNVAQSRREERFQRCGIVIVIKPIFVVGLYPKVCLSYNKKSYIDFPDFQRMGVK